MHRCPVCEGSFYVERWSASGHLPGWILGCEECSANFEGTPWSPEFTGFEDERIAADRMTEMARALREAKVSL